VWLAISPPSEKTFDGIRLPVASKNAVSAWSVTFLVWMKYVAWIPRACSALAYATMLMMESE